VVGRTHYEGPGLVGGAEPSLIFARGLVIASMKYGDYI
jgi:hypothetical protein